MGSRIAAHLANAGIPVLLLDMVPPGEGDRGRLAKGLLESLGKAKPAAFYDASLAALVMPGNFEDDLAKLAACDWVIEAVAENLAIKTALLARVVPHLAPQAVLTTNTSGLPVMQDCGGAVGRAGSGSSGRTSSTRRGICGCWRLFLPPRPIRPWWRPLPHLPTGTWASRWCLPTTRPTSLPTALAWR